MVLVSWRLTHLTSREAWQRLGEQVRAARLAANLTQQELAGQTFSKSYLSVVERGKMTPSFQALLTLAGRLGVTLSSLLGEEKPQPHLEASQAAADEDQQAAVRNEVERFVQQGRYEEALDLLLPTGRKEAISRVYEAYARFLADQGRYQEAYEQMRRALDR